MGRRRAFVVQSAWQAGSELLAAGYSQLKGNWKAKKSCAGLAQTAPDYSTPRNVPVSAQLSGSRRAALLDQAQWR